MASNAKFLDALNFLWLQGKEMRMQFGKMYSVKISMISFLVLVCFSFHVSCGNDGFSQSQAEKMIAEKLKESDKITGYLWLEFLYIGRTAPAETLSEIPSIGRKKLNANERILRQKGLLKELNLTYKEKAKKTYYAVYRTELSDEVSHLIVQEYKQKHPILNGFKKWHKLSKVEVSLGEVELVSIESVTKPAIQDGKNVCEAVCVVKFNPNTIAKDIIPSKKFSTIPKMRAKFVQYTDGWKLDSLEEL
jgi:hypothetical protein